MLTFWDDIDAIKGFAGDDFGMAKYYDFDYQIEKGARHRALRGVLTVFASSTACRGMLYQWMLIRNYF
jgi:hypothetical protein